MATGLLAGSFVLSLVLTAAARKLSMWAGFAAHPAEDRFHDSVVPLGGGAAIFWTVALVISAGAIIVNFFVAQDRLPWLGQAVTIHAEGFLSRLDELSVMMVCLLALHLLGLWDDRKHLGPVFKLAVQFVVAGAAAYFGDIRVELFIESRIITSAMSAFWIVLIINAFNFLDNMDGLSAGVAVIASAVLFSAAALSGQLFIGALALVFIGAMLGFLVFNFPPAKIFMGDAGSLVVGFLVATLTLRTTYYDQAQGGGLYVVLMPLVVMAVPLYDFVSVTMLRISQGKSPFVGDTQHFSHRLKRRGLSDTQTVLTLYLATLCTGLSAIFLYRANLVEAILIFAQTIMILVIIAIMEATG